MKRTRIIILILSLLLIIIGCTNDDTTSTTPLTTTKDTVTTTTVDNNSSTTSSKEITTTKEDTPTTTTTYNEPTTKEKPVTTTTKEVVTTTKENITTTQEIVTTTQEIITTTEEIVTTTQEIITTTKENITTEHVHNYSTDWVIVQPTDTANGYRYRKCNNCDDIYIDPDYVIDSLSYIDGLVFELTRDETYYFVSAKEDYEYEAVVIPATYNNKPVKEIKTNGFSGLNNIKSVYISPVLNRIGTNAFNYCTSLERVEISDLNAFNKISVDSVSYNPLYFAHYLYLNGKLVETINANDIHIDSERYNGYMFTNCWSLKSVSIPYGVTYVAGFQNCKNITSISIPSSVKTIGTNAFSGCSSLRSVRIPEGVEIIEDNAFNSCTSLKSIYFPSTAKLSINGNMMRPFLGCTSLESIVVDENNPYYTSGNGSNALIYRPGYYGGLVIGTKNTIIPNYVSDIRSYAFYNLDISEITIPNSVEGIGEYAFSGSSLTTINIPSGVLTLGRTVFGDCQNLKTVVLNEGLKYIDVNCFINCPKLESINIPSSVNEIGGSLFYGCSSLKEIKVSSQNTIYTSLNNNVIIEKSTNKIIAACNASTIPDSVTSIGRYAFAYTNFKTITIPDSVIEIDQYAFYNCEKLKSINLSNNLASMGNYALSNCLSLESITIPDSLTTINNNVFYNDTSLENIILPNTIENIQLYAFQGCPSIKYNVFGNGCYLGSIDNPYLACVNVADESINNITIHENCLIIGGYGILNAKLNYVILPKGIKYITNNVITSLQTNYCFYKGTEEELSAFKKQINSFTSFEYNYNYENIEFVENDDYSYFLADDNNVLLFKLLNKDIKYFDFNEALPGLTIKSIAYGSFANCSFLTTITIPESVEIINKSCFSGCTKLYEIINKSNIELNSAILNSEYGASSSVRYLSNDESVLEKDGKFIIHKDGDEVILISYDGDDETIIIPDNVTIIYEYAFSNYKSLVTIGIGSSVKAINSNAFTSCTSLKKVIIKNLEGWCNIVFENDYYTNPSYFSHDLYLNDELLTDLIIPEGVTTINKIPFYYCTSIKNVTIPSSVTTIDTNAFYNSIPLQSIEVASDNEYYKSNNGCLYSKDLKKLILATTSIGENYIVSEGTESIEIYAFDRNTTLKTIIFPSTLKTIGRYAFNNCNMLEAVDIPNSLTKCGLSAFYKCTSLNKVNIKNIEAWCKIEFEYEFFYSDLAQATQNFSNPLYYAQNLYLNDELVKTLVIPNAVETLRVYTFTNCKSIEVLVLPESITSLESIIVRSDYANNVNRSSLYIYYPFYGCSNIKMVFNYSDKSLSLGSEVLGRAAYYALYVQKCTGSVIDFDANDIDSLVIGNITRTIDDSISTTDENGFVFKKGMDGATKWFLTDYLGEDTDIIFPESFIYDGETITSYTIDTLSFTNNKNITSVTIPNASINFGKTAFYGCTNLKTVYNYRTNEITQGTSNYGFVAFYADKVYNYKDSFSYALNTSVGEYLIIRYTGNSPNVIIPNRFYFSDDVGYVYEFGLDNNSFFNLDFIKTIELSEAVVAIGDYVFNNCDILESITITKSLKKIGKDIFKDCVNLSSIIYNGTKAEWNEIEIDPSNKLPKIICTDGTIE